MPDPNPATPGPSPGQLANPYAPITHEGGSHKLVAMFNLRPKSLTEAVEFSKLMATSQLVPKQYQAKPNDILIAVQMGAEVGLSPLQSLNSICVIHERPTMWGDGLKAVVDHSGVLAEFEERDSGAALAQAEGYCRVKRKGQPACPKDDKGHCTNQANDINGVCCTTRRFTLEDATRAGLIARSDGKKENAQHGVGPWQCYPGRMLMMRARAWALRDTCGDVLKGLQVREEIEDIKEADARIDGQPAMPRRRSQTPMTIDAPEVQKGAADEALASMRTSAGGGAPTKSATRTNGGGGGDKPAGQSWTGQVRLIEKKAGGTTAKPWTKYSIHTVDGEKFGTFDATAAKLAEGFRQTGELAVIEWNLGAYGKDLTGIRAADQPPGDAPQDEPGERG